MMWYTVYSKWNEWYSFHGCSTLARGSKKSSKLDLVCAKISIKCLIIVLDCAFSISVRCSLDPLSAKMSDLHNIPNSIGWTNTDEFCTVCNHLTKDGLLHSSYGLRYFGEASKVLSLEFWVCKPGTKALGIAAVKLDTCRPRNCLSLGGRRSVGGVHAERRPAISSEHSRSARKGGKTCLFSSSPSGCRSQVKKCSRRASVE